ncbi:PRTRC system protein E [Collimonas sp. H4R21]|uniref:PRTRC system protein E n=1 Tax=Collimonas rhizosphaerae TaxID=3126357 RepID=A0ABU9PXS1_9BURK
MFSALQALTQKATLLIVVAAEGELLRVSITPTITGKDADQPLHPISLVATPAELDAGFVEALNAWQVPRRSLIEQVEAAAAASDENNDRAKKPAATKTTKPLTPKQAAKVAKTAKPHAEPEVTAQGTPSATPNGTSTSDVTPGDLVGSGSTPSPTGVFISTTQSAEPNAMPPRAADSNAMPPDAPGDPVVPAESATQGPPDDKFTIDLF